MRSTNQRGYGAEHQRLRKQWAKLLDDIGQLPCTRASDRQCSGFVTRGQEWELDHTDDRTGYLGIAHKACNRRHGGWKSQQISKTVPSVSRSW